jgi:hypothetical protein
MLEIFAEGYSSYRQRLKLPGGKTIRIVPRLKQKETGGAGTTRTPSTPTPAFANRRSLASAATPRSV